jgi:hypothetical protein
MDVHRNAEIDQLPVARVTGSTLWYCHSCISRAVSFFHTIVLTAAALLLLPVETFAYLPPAVVTSV